MGEKPVHVGAVLPGTKLIRAGKRRGLGRRSGSVSGSLQGKCRALRSRALLGRSSPPRRSLRSAPRTEAALQPGPGAGGRQRSERCDGGLRSIPSRRTRKCEARGGAGAPGPVESRRRACARARAARACGGCTRSAAAGIRRTRASALPSHRRTKSGPHRTVGARGDRWRGAGCGADRWHPRARRTPGSRARIGASRSGRAAERGRAQGVGRQPPRRRGRGSAHRGWRVAHLRRAERVRQAKQSQHRPRLVGAPRDVERRLHALVLIPRRSRPHQKR